MPYRILKVRTIRVHKIVKGVYELSEDFLGYFNLSMVLKLVSVFCKTFIIKVISTQLVVKSIGMDIAHTVEDISSACTRRNEL